MYIKKLIIFISSFWLFVSMGTVYSQVSDDSQKLADDAVKVADSDFPGRKTYPHVSTISRQDLHSEYDDVVIVDARSPYEYETLRILSAVNIPLSLGNSDFTRQVQALRDENPDKKIVFYCNGHTCMKSYKAATRAKLIAKVENVHAFDAGIFDWTNAYPDKAILLGETPVNTSKLISKSNYKKHVLPALDFIKQATTDSVILDVRSRHQREGFYVFSGFEELIEMENKKKLRHFIKKAKDENKKVYIYDAVGKQVRWLQYYLETLEPGPYYFMEGGAMAFFDIPQEKLIDN